jgi:hypothetical protein
MNEQTSVSSQPPPLNMEMKTRILQKIIEMMETPNCRVTWRVGITEANPDPHGFMRFVSDKIFVLSLVTAMDTIEVVMMMNPITDRPFATMSEREVCAMLRQMFHQSIPYDGESGSIVHDLLNRIQRQVGRDRYNEYVGGPFPDRLKSPKTGAILTKK